MRSVRRVLLVFPATPMLGKHDYIICVPPLGLAHVAAMLEGKCEIRILDATLEGYGKSRPAGDGKLRMYGLSPEELRPRIEAEKPDILGVSVLYSGQAAEAIGIAAVAKEIGPEMLVVLGGTHPTFLPEQILRSGVVDFVVMGEGEIAFAELVDALGTGKDAERVSGLGFLREGKVHVTPSRQPLMDIDSLPLPARFLLPMERYIRLNMPVFGRYAGGPAHPRSTNLLATRGCPFSCCFCASARFWGAKLRKRSVRSVVSEIAMLKQRFAIREVQFVDDNLTLDTEWAKQLCREIIRSDISIEWCPANGVFAPSLDHELLSLMRESGCYALPLAFESGCQEVLDDIIGKPLDLGKSAEIARMAKSLGFIVNVSFVMGFPGETLEQVKRTADFASQLDIDLPQLLVATPVAGSRLYDECLRLGLISEAASPQDFDFSSAHFDTGSLSRRDLEAVVSRHFIRSTIGLCRRNPRLFSRLALTNFLASPDVFLRRCFSHLRTMFPRG